MKVRKNISIILLICLFLAALGGPAIGRTIYVDPNGSADFNSIQAAIDDVNDYDEIEVALGTYYEAIDFKGKAVRLYSSGGPEVTTIDATGLSSSVVNCTSGEGLNTILTGFTITGGTGNPDIYGQLCGGGMRNESSSPTVANCIFTSNSAEFGGGLFNYAGNAMVSDCTFTNNTVSRWGAGLYNNNSSPTVTNCTFSSNTASEKGGGMYNYSSSSPTVNNCTFSGNTATEFGGGMYNGNTSNPAVSDCNFTDNSAREGGGMHNGSSSNPTVSDCSFSNNTADWGGGMYNHTSSPKVINCTFNGNNAVTATDDGRGGGMFNNWYSSPLVTECIFISNSSDDCGGGMYNYDYSSPTVINCTFRGNTATVVGGGIANANNSSPTVINGTFSGNTAAYGAGMHGNFSSSPTMTNCAFSGNTAGTDGGGMYNTNSSSPTLTNCTLIGNTAGDRGGAIFSYNGSPTVTNCILWGNTPDELYDMGGVPTVTYSDVQGGYAGTGNINADPCFFEYTGQQDWSDNFDSYSLGSINGVGGWQGWNNDPDSAGSVDDSHSLSAPHSQFISPSKDSVHTYAGYLAGQLTYTAYQYISSDSSGITCFIILNDYNNYGPYSWSVQIFFDTSSGLLNDIMTSGDENVAIIFDQWVPIVVNVNLATNVYEIFYGATLVSTYELSGGPKALEAVDLFSPSYSNVYVWYDDMSLVCKIINASLESDSPCIDAGDTTEVPGGTWADLGGNPRVLDDPQTPDTGVSLSGLTVDMGAYEFYCSGIPGDVNCDGVVDFKDMAVLCNNWLAGTEPEL